MEWIFLAIAAYVVYRWLVADTKSEDGARQPTTTREPGYGEHPRHQGHSRGRASSSGGRTNADVEHTVKQAIDAGKNIKFNYTDKEGARTMRTVRPRRLFDYAYEGGTMRCVEAHCYLRGADRTFAIFRMSSVEIT